jgi:DNA-binding response OmpR family regulator
MMTTMTMVDPPSHVAGALTPHVLALDDDPSVRQLVHDYLIENELRVTAVSTGAELDTVLERETIDLIVLDLRLQGEDGMQIARRLRESSTIPILMLTGRAEEADRVMGLELGADDYLTKPFSPRELLARAVARPAARPLAAAQRRGLRPLDRRADPAPAAQDRGRSGAAEVHQDRARRRLPVRFERRRGDLSGRRSRAAMTVAAPIA